jgi:hypothetical protein
VRPSIPPKLFDPSLSFLKLAHLLFVLTAHFVVLFTLLVLLLAHLQLVGLVSKKWARQSYQKR